MSEFVEKRWVDWRQDRLEVSREGYLDPFFFLNKAYNYPVANGNMYEVGFHDPSKLYLDVVNICMIS